MPELPEVETIRTQLSSTLPAKIISIKQSKNIKSIAHTNLSKLKSNTIHQIDRKGKMLSFILDNGYHLLSHLGMTGTWRYSTSPLNEKHGHLEIKAIFNNSEFYLTYVDPRRFGHMYLYNKKDSQTKLSELGHDLKSPLFTLDYFLKSLKRYPERAVKVTLLDQSLFAGTGNYIANEICARAFVRPTRRVKTLTKNEITSLFKAIDMVLDPALKTGGTTFQGGYQDANGEKGQGVGNLVVFYQKLCQMCQDTPIKKITLAARGTYYCPNCQK